MYNGFIPPPPQEREEEMSKSDFLIKTQGMPKTPGEWYGNQPIKNSRNLLDFLKSASQLVPCR